MKTCSKCKQTKQSTEFNKDSRLPDQLTYKCKECNRQYLKIYNLKNKKRNSISTIRWQKQNQIAYRTYQKQWQSKNRDKICTVAKKQRIKNPIATAARIKFNNAIRDGKIKRLPCIICQSPNSQGHHTDYSKPFEVIWLCRKHHERLHHKTLCA